MKNTISWKRGFTLVELLVVLAIVAVVVALTIPAIQQSRNAARQVGCKNNLKLIGLALHNYHDVFNTFPPGYVADPNVKAPGNGLWTWSAFILPFIDQASLYNQIAPGPFTASQALDRLPEGLPAIPTYKCPEDPSPAVNDAPGRSVKTTAKPKGLALATSNYLGINNTWGLLNNRDPKGNLDGTSGAHGLFFKNSKIGLRDITDGTSNTVMVGERKWMAATPAADAQPYQIKAAVACVMTANGKAPGTANQHVAGAATGSDDGLVFGLGAAITKINDVSAEATARDACRQSFSSQHAGGAYFSFCDGSVRLISDEIDHSTTSPDAKKDAPIDSTFEYLIGIDDGNPIGEF